MLGTVYVDFDGTIAPGDPTDTIFDRFCDQSWRLIERELQQGLCTAQYCLARQVRLMRATPEVLDKVLQELSIDEWFHDFVELCRRWQLQIAVLSDGMDRVVRQVLRTAGLELPFHANRLEWQGGDRWKLSFPRAWDDCRASPGNCRCGHRYTGKGGPIEIVVGDGRSGFCIAERAQLVLAKTRLAKQCRSKSIPFWPMEDLADATATLASWLAENMRKSA
jgi:2-hydroxy-3-keto-5-methylthiopentenyl-1-phosphate phosphatase